MTSEQPVWRPGVELSAWPDLKFARALQHMSDLQARIGLWNLSAPVYTDKVISGDGRTASVVLRLRSQPPLEEWALVLGDLLHNMRSALDAVAWEVTHLNGASPANPKQVYFPIAKNPEAWARAATTLESAPAEAVERIRLVQPYLYPQGRSLLEVLHLLDVQDKHRTAITARLVVTGINLNNSRIEFEDESEIPDPPFRAQILNDIPFVDGTTLIRFHSTARMKSLSAPMLLENKFLVALEDEHLDLQETLNGLLQQVRGTLDLIFRGLVDPATADPNETGEPWQEWQPDFVASLDPDS